MGRVDEATGGVKKGTVRRTGKKLQSFFTPSPMTPTTQAPTQEEAACIEGQSLLGPRQLPDFAFTVNNCPGFKIVILLHTLVF